MKCVTLEEGKRIFEEVKVLFKSVYAKLVPCGDVYMLHENVMAVTALGLPYGHLKPFTSYTWAHIRGAVQDAGIEAEFELDYKRKVMRKGQIVRTKIDGVKVKIVTPPSQVGWGGARLRLSSSNEFWRTLISNRMYGGCLNDDWRVGPRNVKNYWGVRELVIRERATNDVVSRSPHKALFTEINFFDIMDMPFIGPTKRDDVSALNPYREGYWL
jgi:hypothetical protein